MKLLRSCCMALLVLSVIGASGSVSAAEAGARAYFQKVRHEPALLRSFLYAFPKGGDLHNHLDGAIYAESYIRWAAEDGKCIDLESFMITAPPCNAETGLPAVSAIRYDGDMVNRIIDAFSIRNYEHRGISGHDQFFSTFRRFVPAGVGHEGDMLAESSARSARQNIIYLELLQSWGMAEARQLALTNEAFGADTPLADLIRHPDIENLAAATILKLDGIEQQWRAALGCGQAHADAGCDVTVRYLAQVIRTFPPAQVLAQTLLAYHLIEKDPRYVGLNFVAPEDHPITRRDYRWQMEMIGELAVHFPAAKDGITLHAGEVVMGLVPPDQLGWHIRAALEVAGARRIGHGIDIFYDPQATRLMEQMAERGILVEINLTSNDAILGVQGERHPIRAYRKYNVPIALSTDDEGVARIDLTHEYQRAVEDHDLSYDDLKYLSRNALAYSFLSGENLLESTRTGKIVKECNYDLARDADQCPTRTATGGADQPEQCEDGDERLEAIMETCLEFMFQNDKARLQSELERRFKEFEANYR